MGSININYEGKTESHEMEALPEKQGGEGDATTVTYVDPDGNKTNVADELNNINNSLKWKKIVASSTGISSYKNDELVNANEVIIRNGYDACINVTGGMSIWCHMTSISYFTDVTYIFNASEGSLTVNVNASVGWDAKNAYIKDVFYR